MHVRVTFHHPFVVSDASENKKGPHYIHDWVTHHLDNALRFEWSDVPNVGDEIWLKTESGYQIYGIVRRRIWELDSDDNTKVNYEVTIVVEITNEYDITGPLY